ncbi:hypothetical protein RvY_17667 [Ramazzottius varieornatus]|uniref:Chordin n=1 Tax=Ramazzottius varieornatus TaxID=947166 RepID=A0A1D1W2Z6_RAMVA|nr:hypothetical protein RvY_17667 [Ramazzottius varieornatus]
MEPRLRRARWIIRAPFHDWEFTFVSFLLLAFLSIHSLSAGRIPLKADDEVSAPDKEKIPGCHFDGHFFELEEQWHPDLGPPFGVMYCVKCTCLAVPRKGQMTGKVRCQNFKHECPKTDCAEPVLLPNQCCKVCPQLPSNNKNDQDKPVQDASKNADFLALFTGANSAQVAVGFFHYDTSGLHYTIQTSRGLSATNLLFLDEDNNTFFNQKLDKPNENDNKICGVWERVPRLYRRNLAKDTLSVALVTAENPETSVKGMLTSRRTQSEDTFSALLQPKDNRKSGLAGVALVSLGADGISLEYSISLKGLSLARKDLKQVATITLEKPDERRVVKEVTSVLSPKALEVSGRMADIAAQDIKWLARGRLTLSLKVSGADFDLTGAVTIRPTCSVWQAVLYDVSRTKSQGGPGSGVALFHPQSDGTFTYELQLMQFPGRPTHMTIETYPRKGRRRVVDDIVSSFGNGWANGSYIKQIPKDIQSLMADDLVMNIVNEHTVARMQGHIKQVYYKEVHNRIFPSVIMENPDASFSRETRDSSGTAVAWIRLDENCILNYQVFIDGYAEPYIKKLQPTVVYSIDQEGSAVSRQVQLEQFKKNKSVGKVKKSDVLMGMQNGTIEMTITASGEAIPRLRGRVTVVDECSGNKHKFNGLIMEDAASLAAPVFTCRYNDKTYPDGSSFRSETKNCTMCSCQRGKVSCEDQICPKPNCRNPVKLEGHCCVTCPVPGLLSTVKLVASNASQGCYLDKKFYRPGETWHPYLPPFGFSKCAVCTCQPGSLTVNCNRITCPTLSCPDNEAIRENPNDCCKKCKDAPKVIPPIRQPNDSLADEAIVRLAEEELKEGGCRMQSEIFKNGAEWHPRVQPFGIMNCVRCHCKDGKSSCKRQKCPKLSCSFVRKEPSECCPVCTNQSDPKARPNRRLLKTKRRQRRRKE